MCVLHCVILNVSHQVVALRVVLHFALNVILGVTQSVRLGAMLVVMLTFTLSVTPDFVLGVGGHLGQHSFDNPGALSPKMSCSVILPLFIIS